MIAVWSYGPAGRRRRLSPFVSSLLLISHDESLLSPTVISALEQRTEWMGVSQRTVGTEYKSRQRNGWFRPFRLGSSCRPDLQIDLLEAALGLRCGGGSSPATNLSASTIMQKGQYNYQIQDARNIPPPPPPPPPLSRLTNHSPRHKANTDTRREGRTHVMGRSALHRGHSIAPTSDDPLQVPPPPPPPPPPLIHRNEYTRSNYDTKSRELFVNQRRPLPPPPPPPPIPQEEFQYKRPYPRPPPVHLQRNELDHGRDVNYRMVSNSNDRMIYLAQEQSSGNTDHGDAARPKPFVQNFPPPPPLLPPPPPLTSPDMNWDDIEQPRANEGGKTPSVDYTREIVNAAMAEADNFFDSRSSDSDYAGRPRRTLDDATRKVQGPHTARSGNCDEKTLFESNGIDVDILRKLIREELEKRLVIDDDTAAETQSSSFPSTRADADSINDTHLAHPRTCDGSDTAVDEFDSDHIDESVLHQLDSIGSVTDHYYDTYDDSCFGDDTAVYEEVDTGYRSRIESESIDSVEAHWDKARDAVCGELSASQYEDFDSDYIDESILASLELVDDFIDDGESSDDDAYGLEAEYDAEPKFGELPGLAVLRITELESPLPTDSAFAGYGVPTLSSPSGQYRREDDRRVEIPANRVDLFAASKAAAKCIKQETLSNATYGMPIIKFESSRKRSVEREVQRTILSRLNVDGISSINEDELDQIIADLTRKDDENFESIEEQSSVQYDFAQQMRRELASVYFATDGREKTVSSAMNGVGDTESMLQDECAAEPYDNEEYSYDYEYDFITEEY